MSRCPNCLQNPSLPLATLPLATKIPNLEIIWDQAEEIATSGNLDLPGNLEDAIEYAVSLCHVHRIGSFFEGFDCRLAYDVDIDKKISGWMYNAKNFVTETDELGRKLLEKAIAEHLPYRIPFFVRAADIHQMMPELDAHLFGNLYTEVEREPPPYMEQFPPVVINTLLKNTAIIELNRGCSVRCNFCGFDAEKNVSNIMPFKHVAWMMRNFKPDDRIIYYYATDPLDYPYYKQVFLLHRLIAGEYPFTATAYPMAGAEQFASMDERIQRLSLSHMNAKRLARDGQIILTKQKGVIPLTPDLRESMCFGFLGGRGQSEWAYNHHFKGVRRFSESEYHREHSVPGFFLGKIFGRDNDFYNFLIKQKAYQAGRYRKEDSGVRETIACRDGVLLTPTDAKNTVMMLSTDAYPKGFADAILEVDNLYDGYYDVVKATYIEDLLPYCIVKRRIRDMWVADFQKAHPEIQFIAFRGGTSVYGKAAVDRETGRIDVQI
jgi:hypothetical protein